LYLTVKKLGFGIDPGWLPEEPNQFESNLIFANPTKLALSGKNMIKTSRTINIIPADVFIRASLIRSN
jgi:hypothetical protein